MNKLLKNLLLITSCVLLDVVSNMCKTLKRKLEKKIPRCL